MRLTLGESKNWEIQIIIRYLKETDILVAIIDRMINDFDSRNKVNSSIRESVIVHLLRTDSKLRRKNEDEFQIKNFLSVLEMNSDCSNFI